MAVGLANPHSRAANGTGITHRSQQHEQGIVKRRLVRRSECWYGIGGVAKYLGQFVVKANAQHEKKDE